MSFKVFLPFIVAGIIFFIHEKLSFFYTDIIIQNRGISFGQNLPGILFLTVVIFGIIFWLYLKEKSAALIMILAGGGINFFDRIRFGFVRDYWQISNYSIYNNINDWIIFFGVLLFFFKFLWIQKSK